MKITIFGTGYVGAVSGASLASLGHQVLSVDIDAQKITALQRGEISFYEPGLPELILEMKKNGRLHFSPSLEEGVHFGEVLFNCVGTPSREDGSADLQAIWSVTRLVATQSSGYKILVNKSTVPPGTARKCQQLIREINPAADIDVLANPEFLKQGNAVYDFSHPDKVIIGSSSPRAVDKMRQVYLGLLRMYVPFLTMNWETAEMVKYANNAFLATKISFINEIANLCGVVGAEVREVAKAIGTDYRIGPKFLNAGLGYGGSCFPKDVRALIQTAREKGYTAKLLQEVHDLNERQQLLFAPLIIQKLREVKGTTATLWGLSFKPKTNDLRGAPALKLIRALLPHGVTVKVYDPVAMPEAKEIFADTLVYCHSLEESVKDSNLLVLVTEWDEFRNVDFTTLGKLMKTKIIFDGRNIYEPALLREQGFTYYGVGQA